MGLDMYAYRIKGNLSSEKKPCINSQPEEFFYWRKNRHLNNVMKNIFIRKYGRNEEFNCRLLNLDSNDLDYIENLIRSDRIEEYDAPGLFFLLFFLVPSGNGETGNTLNQGWRIILVFIFHNQLFWLLLSFRSENCRIMVRKQLRLFFNRTDYSLGSTAVLAG